MTLSSLQTLLLDGDGVLWRASQPVPGLQRFFEVLAARGIGWALITNNATSLAEKYVDRLAGYGVSAEPEQIFTSSTVTADYLLDRFGAGQAVYVIGEQGLYSTLAAAGFDVFCGEDRPPVEVAAVVASMDRQVNYGRLTVATRLIRGGAPFIATNPDRTFPLPDGLAPGAGSIVAALVATTEVEPLVIGKPQPTIFLTALRHLGADLATTAMVGDRLETDILGAQRVGLRTIAVLTGVSTREQVAASPYQPDFVFEGIADLADALAP
jgi:4-nitrophenyl phosphatase